MTSVPETPLPASDKLVSAIDEYTKKIEADLRRALADNATLNRQLDATTNEAGLLREQLAAKTKAFEAVQAYAVRLDTKYEMIVDIIGGIKAESMEYGKKTFTGTATDAADDGAGDGDGIAAILKRLPANSLRPS